MELATQWVKPSELVGLPGLPLTHQGVNKLINRQSIPTRPHHGRGGGREVNIASLPESTQKHFLLKNYSNPVEGRIAESERRKQLESENLWRQYERKPNKAKNVAKKRLQVVQAVFSLMAAGEKKGAAKRKVAEATGIHHRTIYRWLESVKGYHRSDWLPALLPRHKGCLVEAPIPPQAWEYFKADYLRLEKPTAQSVYDRTQRASYGNDWGDLPAVSTFMRKLRREISRPVLILAREGVEALGRTYPAQERDKSVFHALEAVNADGHKFDVFVRFLDGEVRRPVMVAFQDLYSGKILSWRVAKTENVDSIRLAFGDILQWLGIPNLSYLDNGRGFAAKWMTGRVSNRYRFKIREEDPVGIMPLVGTEVHWCTPYHGQAKPIERAFRDMCDRIAKHPGLAGAYTGNNPNAKPENYGSKAVDYRLFEKIVNQEIHAHNARKGRRSKVCAGRSFDDVFNESYAKATIRKATAEQRRLWLLAAENVTASRLDGSVTFLNNRYYCDELSEYAGSKVVARFDPDNLHSAVYVETLDGRFIGKADCVQAAGFNDSQAAREHNRKRNQFKKAVKKQLEAERGMKTIEAVNFLPDIEAPEIPLSKVVKAQFENASENSISPEQFQEYFGKGVKLSKQA